VKPDRQNHQNSVISKWLLQALSFSDRWSRGTKTQGTRLIHTLHLLPPSRRQEGFIKGEALRLLRTNSSKPTFEENITQFKRRLRDRGYPDNLLENTLSEIKLSERMSALQNKQKTGKRILPFVTESPIWA